tara:strand:- start:206 stop:475 length:270 start_codon:yes stop_codon:yes gene_type:complete
MSTTIKIPDYELFDLVCLCHAALAQDSPELPSFYVNEILGRLDAFKYPGMREEIEVYLAEKKYLPPLKLVRPNEASSNAAAQSIITDSL